MELITKRFLLREFVEDDLPVFAAYHNDPRSLEFYRAEEAPGHAQDLFDVFKAWAEEHPRRNYQLAIAKRDDSKLLIGCCGLRGADYEVDKAELGIELAPQYWGRYGYAVEVMRALVEFGFGSLGLRRFTASLSAPTIRLHALPVRLDRLQSPSLPLLGWLLAVGVKSSGKSRESSERAAV